MKLKIGLFAAFLFSAGTLTAATAMPIAPPLQVSDVTQARMICDAWGRCVWRRDYYGYYGPRYYAPRYYAPRYYGYYGYRRW